MVRLTAETGDIETAMREDINKWMMAHWKSQKKGDNFQVKVCCQNQSKHKREKFNMQLS